MNRHLRGAIEINMPSDSGIYFLCQGEEVVYVGQSTAPEMRVAQHKKNGKKFDRILFLPVEAGDLDRVESLFIALLRPKLNGMAGSSPLAPIAVRDLCAEVVRKAFAPLAAPKRQRQHDAPDSPASEDPRRLISQLEVCHLLSWSPATLYRRLNDDERFPQPVRLGRSVRFLKADVDRYIAALVEDGRRPAPIVTAAATRASVESRRKRGSATPK